MWKSKVHGTFVLNRPRLHAIDATPADGGDACSMAPDALDDFHRSPEGQKAKEEQRFWRQETLVIAPEGRAGLPAVGPPASYGENCRKAPEAAAAVYNKNDGEDC